MAKRKQDDDDPGTQPRPDPEAKHKADGAKDTAMPKGHRTRGVHGHPELTSATLTAVAPQDTAADQSDRDMEAFFGTGSGPAMHYHVQPQAAESQEVQKTGATP